MFKKFKGFSRNIIFVSDGTHKGEFLVEVDRKDDKRIFLGLPGKSIHEVSSKDVEDGLKNKVLRVVDKLPRCVYNVCKKEYQLILGEQQQRIHSNN